MDKFESQLREKMGDEAFDAARAKISVLSDYIAEFAEEAGNDSASLCVFTFKMMTFRKAVLTAQKAQMPMDAVEQMLDTFAADLCSEFASAHELDDDQIKLAMDKAQVLVDYMTNLADPTRTNIH